MSMLFAIKETLAQKARIGELVLPDQGKAESVKTLRTTVESQTPQDLNAWVQARRHLPTFERHGHPRKSRITFAVEGSISYKWKKQEASWEEGPAHAAGGIPGNSAGRLIQQEEDSDRRPNQARPPTLRSRSTAGKSSSRKHGETVERCMPVGRERRRWRWQPTRTVAKAAGKMEGQAAHVFQWKKMNSSHHTVPTLHQARLTAPGRAAGGGKRQRRLTWMACPHQDRGKGSHKRDGGAARGTAGGRNEKWARNELP